MNPEELNNLWQEYQASKGADLNALWAEYQAQPQVTQPKPTPSIGRTMLDQSLQGATLGFADEATDRVGAGVASLFTDEKYSDLLNESRNLSNERLQNEFEQRPILSAGSNIAGAILTGGAAGTTKAGTAIGNYARSGNLASRIAKGATIGAASGAAYGAGSAEDNKRLEGAKSGALLGAAFGGGLPAVAAGTKSLAKGTKAGLEKLATPKIIEQATADDVRKLAGEAYKFADETGGILTPQFTNNFLNKVESFTPQTKAGKLLAGDDPVSKIAEKMQGLRDKEISLAEAQEIDEFLGDTIDNFTEMGRVTKQGKKLLDIQTEFRNSIDNVAEGDLIGGQEGFEALKQGRKLWSRAAKLRDIEKIISRAEMTENPATSIKAGFRNLASNPARFRGYSAKERELIKKAAETGIASDLLGIVGSRLNPIIAGSTGGLGAAAASQATSMAARGLKAKLQVNRAQNVAAEIAGDTNKVAQPTAINKAAQKLLGKPTNKPLEIPIKNNPQGKIPPQYREKS